MTAHVEWRGDAGEGAISPNDVTSMLAALTADTTAAGKRDRAFFAFLLGTGARLGSARALDVADLDPPEIR